MPHQRVRAKSAGSRFDAGSHAAAHLIVREVMTAALSFNDIRRGVPLISLRPLKATINLEYLRLNYQLSNKISFSGLISVLDAEVGHWGM